MSESNETTAPPADQSAGDAAGLPTHRNPVVVAARAQPALASAALLVLGSALLVAWARTRPGFDPFGWLVWGHQTLHLSLDLRGAPSWKPLPYLFTTPYALTGHFALWLWLVTATAAGLSAAVFAGRIAWILTPAPDGRRWVPLLAAVVAGGATLGIEDYIHDLLSAQSDPMIVALCLAAIERHLSGRHRAALVLGVLAALGRPEVWPFLALYAVWAARAIPSMRVLIAVGLGFIPLMWFGIPALTGASPFVAGNLALHSGRALQSNRVFGTIDRFLDLYPTPIELAALVALGFAVVRRDLVTLALAAGAVAWVGVEIAFALHGWAGLGRYMLEPAGVLGVLAGVAVGAVLSAGAGARWGSMAQRFWPPPLWARGLVVAAFALSLVPGVRARIRTERSDLTHERGRTRQINRLSAVITRVGGPGQVIRCGQPVANIEYQSVLAWQTGLNVGFVGYNPARAIHHGRPLVLFTPRRFGWRVRPVHTLPVNRARCRRMRTATATS